MKNYSRIRETQSGDFVYIFAVLFNTTIFILYQLFIKNACALHLSMSLWSFWDYFYLQKHMLLSHGLRHCAHRLKPFYGVSKNFLLLFTIIKQYDSMHWKDSRVFPNQPLCVISDPEYILCIHHHSNSHCVFRDSHQIHPGKMQLGCLFFTLSQWSKMWWDDFSCSTYFENFTQIELSPFPTSFPMSAHSFFLTQSNL